MLSTVLIKFSQKNQKAQFVLGKSYFYRLQHCTKDSEHFRYSTKNESNIINLYLEELIKEFKDKRMGIQEQRRRCIGMLMILYCSSMKL